MPRRTDISSVLVIGSGPIVIGQACEFDYSGTQACRVLRAEGLRVILVNSNPATIMTDPEFADATYIEPITPEIVAKVIEKERPDALLATLGGQTALNTAMALHEAGVLERVRRRADRRQRRRDRGGGGPAAVQGDRRRAIGAESARSRDRHTMDDCLAAADDLGYPVVVRPVVHHGRRRVGDGATTRPSCAGWPAPACRPARPPRCCSRSRSSAGRSTSSS